MRNAAGHLAVRVAGIVPIEAAESGFKSLRVARLKCFGHAESLCGSAAKRKTDSLVIDKRL
jgi:hypothetical protein